MENENIVTIQFKFTRNKALLLMALFFLCWHPRHLNSETLTLTTYYPAPYGGYVSLLTTGANNVNTLLARDGGNVLMGMPFEAAPNNQKLDVKGNIRASGEMLSTMATGWSQFRAVNGNYGALIRNDGTDTYMPLMTGPGDPYGGWNGLRPLRVNNASGDVIVANSQIIFRHSTGVLEGVCRLVPFVVTPNPMNCGLNERVMGHYGTANFYSGLLFLGGNLNDSSRWVPHYDQASAGSMLCCKIK